MTVTGGSARQSEKLEWQRIPRPKVAGTNVEPSLTSCVPGRELEGLKELVESAVELCAEDITRVFGDGQLAWVIMGGAHESGNDDNRPHWTIRGFYLGRPHYTIHIYQEADEVWGFPNGGR
ncbi:hypothetical protein JOM56_008058 [Amanita muscaria]